MSCLYCPLAYIIITFLGAQAPSSRFRSLGLLDKSTLLFSAFKALHDVILAQHPSFGAHYYSTWCSSTSELLRGSRTPLYLCTCSSLHLECSSHSCPPRKLPLIFQALSFSAAPCEVCPGSLAFGCPFLVYQLSADSTSFRAVCQVES